MKTSTVIGVAAALVIASGAWYWIGGTFASQAPPADYENAAYVVEKDYSNLIRLESPLPYSEVASPLAISGKARGNWFFEASFPVFLVDWDGKIIAQGIATAGSEWMTTDFVPFTATLTFNKADISGQYSNRGALILKKDNPSGLPQYDDALEVPVLLK